MPQGGWFSKPPHSWCNDTGSVLRNYPQVLPDNHGAVYYTPPPLVLDNDDRLSKLGHAYVTAAWVLGVLPVGRGVEEQWKIEHVGAPYVAWSSRVARTRSGGSGTGTCLFQHTKVAGYNWQHTSPSETTVPNTPINQPDNTLVHTGTHRDARCNSGRPLTSTGGDQEAILSVGVVNR